jgi:hypothetical protein
MARMKKEIKIPKNLKECRIVYKDKVFTMFYTLPPELYKLMNDISKEFEFLGVLFEQGDKDIGFVLGKKRRMP